MLDRWNLMILAIGAAGLADSAYLVADALTPAVSLYCPTAGLVNCVTVTRSGYSEFVGVKVAYMGLAWFAVVIVLSLLSHRLPVEYTLLPMWGLGMVFVFYLIFIEVFVLQAVCAYCTIAHALALILGIPIVRLALLSDA